MKQLFGVWALLCPFLSLSQPLPTKPLTVGDPVPPRVLSNIFRHISPTTSAINTKQKALLLDFWATWCTSCLHHFPKLDSLQERFHGDLDIVLVNSANTGDNAQKVTAFFETRRRKGFQYHLASLTEDTALSQLFPHQLLPHYVWISAAGKVMAITYAEAVTPQNLKQFLAGSLQLAVKNDIEYNGEEALLQNGNGGGEDALRFRSVFTGHLDGLGTFVSRKEEGKTKRRTYLNQPLLSLYRSAVRYPLGSVVLEVSDSARYVRGKAPGRDSFLYCYESTVPASLTEEELSSLMVQDLDRYLGVRGRVERRLLPCRVLVVTDSSRLPATKGGKPGSRWYTKEQPVTRFTNQPLSKLADALNNLALTDPLWWRTVDETRVATPVDLELSAPLSDVPGLRKSLQAYGLDLITAERELDVFVLTEKGWKGLPTAGRTTSLPAKTPEPRL